MLRVRLGLAAGLTVLVVALAVVLSRPPLTVAGSNGVPANFAIAFVDGNEYGCESAGTVPRGTEAIRVSLSANIGPHVKVQVLEGSKPFTEGEHAAGWGVTETVTVPVKRVRETVRGARICTAIGPAVEGIQVNGLKVPLPGGGSALRLRMEYLRPGPRSWLSLLPSIARRMGLDRAPSGAWPTYLAIAIMLLVVFLASRLALRELT